MINYFLFSILVTYFISILLKILIEKPFSFKNGFRNGGMPSQHTAAITSITFAIYFAEGPTSTFFLGVVVMLIIMVDASGLRYSVGNQGELLNSILEKTGKKIEVIRGHTKKQVFFGFLLGILVSFGLSLIML
jgi:uncharacterized protein